MRRLGTYTHDASIDIDIADVIAEVTDEELLEELELRRKVNKSPPPVIPFDVLFDVAVAFHDTHSTGVPLHACHNVLCRDATRALAAGQKKGE